jgi:cellulose biosynthesis protein BcsQ
MKQDPEEMGAREQGSSEPADDVATLYSWANLHGAKYRDFSASRQEMRAKMRQTALAERARMAREEAQSAPVDEVPRWDPLPGDSRAGALASPVRHDLPGERKLEELDSGERTARPSGAPAEPGNGTRHGIGSVPHFREEPPGEPRAGRTAEAETASMRPAWLAERSAPVTPMPAPVTAAPLQMPTPQPMPIQAAVPAAIPAQAPVQTRVPMPGQMPAGSEPLQPSRERAGSRWYALRGVLGRSEEAQPARGEGQIPGLAVFSFAGGVGKTSLVAGLGRALAARGERVLLADLSPFGLLPFYFGAREIKPGVWRTFSGGAGDPPIRVLTADTEREGGDPEFLRQEVARAAQDASRVLIDVATGSAAILRQALQLSSVVLVPVVPDMTSVVTLQALEQFFRGQEGQTGRPPQVWYVLSQFDASSRLQTDVREFLRQQLGERLLPMAIHRSAAVSEALAEGMTVLDYAPNAPAAEDIVSLAAWVRETSVAVNGGHRGVRWSER